MTKEEIYDEQINPLMAKIIDICKDHKIALVASFDIGGNQYEEETGERLLCSTVLTTDEYEPANALRDAVKCIYHQYVAVPTFFAMTVSSKK